MKEEVRWEKSSQHIKRLFLLWVAEENVCWNYTSQEADAFSLSWGLTGVWNPPTKWFLLYKAHVLSVMWLFIFPFCSGKAMISVHYTEKSLILDEKLICGMRLCVGINLLASSWVLDKAVSHSLVKSTLQPSVYYLSCKKLL